MGGIAGMVLFDGETSPTDVMINMARRMAHRSQGVLGGGLYPGYGVELWQLGRRPIPAGGSMPAVVLDGNIYNREELISQLGLGNGADDHLIVTALYEKGGPRSMARINGDFALAIYDPKKKSLFLFRDRFGQRPLFYTLVKDWVIFASEVRAFFEHPGFAPTPDPAMLFDYLATHYRYIHRDPGRTFLKGVRQVSPAHYVVLKDGRENIHPYWQLELDPEVWSLSSGEAEERLLDLLRDSISLRLGSDMGFTVSSGMDSSSVCTLAVEAAGEPQDLYSVSYGSGEYDEAPGIVQLAEERGRTWRNIVLSEPSLMASIDRLVRLHEAPLCTVTWLSHFRLAETAAQDGKTVLFSGLGGDECLAGEYEHFLYFFADLKQWGFEDRLKAEVEGWMALHDHPVFKKNWDVVQDVFSRLVDLKQPGRIFPDLKRYRNYFNRFNPDFIKSWDQPVAMACPFDSYLANRCYQDLFYETTPPSLFADEKNVSAFGMTSRFPFLDHRVVTFCYSLHPGLKYDRGITKAVMRRAMKDILTESNILNTVKTGFNAPAGDWLLGKDHDLVLDLLHSKSLEDRGWLKPGEADALFLAHERGEANHMMILWQIINAELWLRNLGKD